jgi:UDP-N-acetylmuramoylalanine--D-glutamate ligase
VKSQRIAILGLGRSGAAVARAAQREGARPVVFEEREPKCPSLATDLQSAGIQVQTNWRDSFDPKEHDLVVTSPGVPMRHPKLQQALSDGIPVIGEIEFAYRISKGPIVAVTGTNGKSTTTVMTWLCLKAAGEEAILCGNIYGSGYNEIPLTEAAEKSTPNQILVAEISSFQLEWVEEFKPVSAGILNISADHLDRYTGFEEYARMKHRIWAAQNEGDTAIFPDGEPNIQPPVWPHGPAIKTYGRQGSAAWLASESLVVEGHRLPYHEVPFQETHNRLNALMAVLLGQGALMSKGRSDVPALLQGLREFTFLSHRMEELPARNGIRLINNSMCTNPRALITSSLSLPGHQHLLIGGVNKELGFTAVGDYLSQSDHRAYLFGKDARAIASEMQQGVELDLWIGETLQEAFEAAASRAREGDTIMLAPGCASTDQFQDFRDRGNVFKQLAKEWLKS